MTEARENEKQELRNLQRPEFRLKMTHLKPRISRSIGQNSMPLTIFKIEVSLLRLNIYQKKKKEVIPESQNNWDIFALLYNILLYKNSRHQFLNSQVKEYESYFKIGIELCLSDICYFSHFYFLEIYTSKLFKPLTQYFLTHCNFLKY